MAAQNTDKFTEVGNPGSATTLAAPGHAIAGTSITVGSTSNHPTATGYMFAIDTVTLVNGVEVRDVGSYTEWEGVVTSSTTIGSMVLRYGTDQNYPAGSTTRVYIPVSSSRENRLVNGLLTSLNQDGTLKDGAVDDAAVLASNVVTNAKIANNAVTEAKITDAAVTVSKINLAPSQAIVATNEATTSSTYAALTTPGPVSTVNIGNNGIALVSIYAKLAQTSNAGTASMGFVISGANTQVAAENYSIMFTRATADDADNQRIGATFLLTGLTPGSTTFTAQYKRVGSTGTANFADRRIAVIPL